jgi:nucleoid-associated protein
MLVRNCIIHYIEQSPESASVKLHLRDSVLPESNVIGRLIGDLHKRYDDSAGKAWGFFRSDQNTYPLSRWLQEYVDGDIDFAGFSQASIHRLSNLLSKSKPFQQDHLLVAHCSLGMTEFLYIAVLRLRSGFAVTEELEVIPSLQLDLNRLWMTARINLSLWETDGESAPYISFIDRQSQVPFAEFIGCEEAPFPLTRCGQSLPTHSGDRNE